LGLQPPASLIFANIELDRVMRVRGHARGLTILDVEKYVRVSCIGPDEAEAPVVEVRLDCPSSHFTFVRYAASRDG
jgi:hypothetical protein